MPPSQVPAPAAVLKAYMYLAVTTLVAVSEGRIKPVVAAKKIRLTGLSRDQVSIARSAAEMAMKDPLAGHKGHDVYDLLRKACVLN